MAEVTRRAFTESVAALIAAPEIPNAIEDDTHRAKRESSGLGWSRMELGSVELTRVTVDGDSAMAYANLSIRELSDEVGRFRVWLENAETGEEYESASMKMSAGPGENAVAIMKAEGVKGDTVKLMLSEETASGGNLGYQTAILVESR